MKIIEVSGRTKHYGDLEAVKGIDFAVTKGAMFAFLGTNGAGKSTTIEILCTIEEKTRGHVIVNGHELGTTAANDGIRKSIGVVFQESLLDDKLTVRENIWHRGQLYGLSNEQYEANYQFVFDALQLESIEQRPYGVLSGGQRRRADIARALIHRPNILFLDEPTTGLDPHARQLVWEVIDMLRAETEMTIFLTTHYMEEAARADDIVIIREGEIVAQGAPHMLKDQYAKDQLLLFFHTETPGTLEKIGQPYDKRGDAIVVALDSTLDALPIVERVKGDISSFEVLKGSLDDVFIRVNETGL